MKKEKLSVSGLKEFSKSLQHYLDYKAKKQEATDAMRFGTALHCAVLEPEKFADKIVVMDIDRRTKEGKVLAEKHKNDTYVSTRDLSVIEAMHRSLFVHPIAGPIISATTEREKWLNGSLTCDHGDVDIHGIADGVVNLQKRKICFDLKTIGDATIDEIEKSIKSYNYHWQAYFYNEMLKQQFGSTFEFFFIFVDKTDHHNVQVVELDEAWLQCAEEQIAPLLDDFYKYLASEENALYRGYSNTIKKIPCPGWVKGKSMNPRFAENLNNFAKPIKDFCVSKKRENDTQTILSEVINTPAIEHEPVKTDPIAEKSSFASIVKSIESGDEQVEILKKAQKSKNKSPDKVVENAIQETIGKTGDIALITEKEIETVLEKVTAEIDKSNTEDCLDF